MQPEPTYKNLRSLNTFGVEASTDAFVVINSSEAYLNLLKRHPVLAREGLVLGGGSNILFTAPPETGVIKPDFMGMAVQGEEGDTVLVTVGAGVVWHDLVSFTLDNSLCGIENLSLIPGNCGAAPMQNIGAYGAELEQVFHQLNAIERNTGRTEIFDASDCRFGYRNSIFKNELRDDFIITSITLKLSRIPELQISYGAIQQTLEEQGITQPTPRQVSEAVIKIRTSKLPDWQQAGNAGSFFKNPVISNNAFNDLLSRYPTVPNYPAGDEGIKIPAAWLIQEAGWKGVKQGDAGSWSLQPLVLVNYGSATGADILHLARRIRDDVLQKFSIRLEPEVNLIGMNQNDF